MWSSVNKLTVATTIVIVNWRDFKGMLLVLNLLLSVSWWFWLEQSGTFLPFVFNYPQIDEFTVWSPVAPTKSIPNLDIAITWNIFGLEWQRKNHWDNLSKILIYSTYTSFYLGLQQQPTVSITWAYIWPPMATAKSMSQNLKITIIRTYIWPSSSNNIILR